MSTPSKLEWESSTQGHSEVGNDFNSEDDDILLKCAESKEDTESIFENMRKSVFMSNNMISYIINFPLSEKFARLNLTVKKIFSIEEENPPEVNYGDWIFSNPWSQKEVEGCRKGVLVSPEINPEMCTCEFCIEKNSPVNLRPGSKGKIQAVHQYAREAGIKDPDILG